MYFSAESGLIKTPTQCMTGKRERYIESPGIYIQIVDLGSIKGFSSQAKSESSSQLQGSFFSFPKCFENQPSFFGCLGLGQDE
jgi:hypothetical protein